MDPTRRDLETEGFVENIIYDGTGDPPYSPSMYLNNFDEGEADSSSDDGAGDGEPNGSGDGEADDFCVGEADGSGDGEAGEVYICIWSLEALMEFYMYIYIYI